MTAAADFHRKSGAAATIVTTAVSDPREYGLVRADSDGRVSGFVEKPGWAQAVTDAANTGIYILSPQVLSYIPEGVAFDFAKDLFPLLLSKGAPLYAYQASGYWCDIGSLGAYLSCQRDILEGKLAPTAAEGGTAARRPAGRVYLNTAGVYRKGCQHRRRRATGPFVLTMAAGSATGKG